MSYVAYCFTINNPTEAETALLTIPFPDGGHALLRCLVFQLESGDNGTPHYQGYLEWNSRKSIIQSRAVEGFSRAHFERRRGSALQAADYCRKEPRLGGPWEYGNFAITSGSRSDLVLFKKDIDDGLTRDALWDKHPAIFARHPHYVRESLERRRVRALPPGVWEPREGWQQDLSALLSLPPHPREVYWYYCATGNSGKSTFARNHPCNAYIVTGGKQADIYYAYQYEPVVIFDWPREAEERVPYGVIEAFKNGYFLSTKYECVPKRFQVPHVIIFANFQPDKSKLSLDRWNEYNIV